jgi:hypothetical protein
MVKKDTELQPGDRWNGKLIVAINRTLGGQSILHFADSSIEHFYPGATFWIDDEAPAKMVIEVKK